MNQKTQQEIFDQKKKQLGIDFAREQYLVRWDVLKLKELQRQDKAGNSKVD